MTQQIDIKAIITHIISGDGINKCRICMRDTTEGQVHLEDTVITDGEKAVTLSEVLEIVTGVQVNLDDDLPTCLCSACARSALSAANFRLFCQRATRQWRITIELLNTLPPKNKNLAAAIIDNKEVLLIDRKSVKKLNNNKSQFEAESDKNVTHRKLSCVECSKEFSHPLQLFYHLKGSFNNQVCYICGDIFIGNDSVLHAAESHKLALSDSRNSPSLLLPKKRLEEHCKHKLSLSRNHSEGCKCVFISDKQTHCLKHKPHKCTKCSTIFNNRFCFLYHMKNCNEPDKTVTNINCLKTSDAMLNKKNKNKSKGTTSCICDYCGKSFAARKFVSAHIQIVHLKNTHRPCLYCGKLLASAHMTEHVKRHLSVQSYTCNVCGIVLKTRLGYVQHKRLHTGEKPYTCNYCGESFSASSRRSEHMRQKHNTKEAVLNHACDLCPARFRLPYRLQKHLLNVHKKTEVLEKKFKCGNCREKFETRRGLLHHNRRKHQLPSIWNKDK